MAGFGTPLSSIPNTSFLNVSEPFSSFGFSGAPLGENMIDPGTATLVGAGLSGIGALGGGVASGKGAKSAAEQAREAAAEQAKMVVQANRENLLGGFGLEKLAQEQETFWGGPQKRFKEFEDAQFSGAMAAGPGAQSRNIQTMAQNLAARQQELSRTGFSPMSRFV